MRILAAALLVLSLVFFVYPELGITWFAAGLAWEEYQEERKEG